MNGDGASRAQWPARPGLLAVLLTLFVAVAAPVLHQEAYYALFAFHPALSYFDHPPMVGWLIWIGTAVLGDGALGVRIMTLACGLALALAGLRLLDRFGGAPATRYEWLLLSVGIPFFAGNRIIAMPDAPLCCFWALTVVALWGVRSSASIRGWLLVGFFAGCALLSKYTAGFLGVGVVLVLVLDPALRRQLLTPGPWLGLAVALGCFAPVVYWNWQHDWASFLFQTQGREVKTGIRLWWTAQLALGQFAGLTPLVAIGSAVAAASWGRRWISGDVRGLWILAFSAPLIVFFAVASLWIQVKLNWLMPAYFTLVIGLLVWLHESGVRERMPRTTAAGRTIALAHAALLILLPVAWLTPARFSNSWSGWTEIAARAASWQERIDAEDGLKGDVFYFATEYEDAGQLEFHLWQLRGAAGTIASVAAENVVGSPAHAFDYWSRVSDHVGHDAILVARRPDGTKRAWQVDIIARYFRSIEPVDRVDAELFGILVQSADIFVCRGYLGPDQPAPASDSR